MKNCLPAKLQAARLRLQSAAPYLAQALYSIRPVERSGFGTLATDAAWRLYWGSPVLDAYSVDDLAGILAHEVAGHLLREHHVRLAQYADAVLIAPSGQQISLANLAGDCEYNDDPILPLPDPVLPRSFGFPDGELAEQYAERLKKGATQLPPKVRICGSSSDGKHRDYEESSSADGISALECDLIRKRVAIDLKQWEAETQGKAPGGLSAWAERILHRPRDWRAELRTLIRGATARASGASDYSYDRPNRRRQLGHGLVLPRMVRETPRVAIVEDTSGSMEAHNRRAHAREEIRALLAQLAAEVALIECDAEVARTRWLRSVDASWSGGGGTDMRTGIAAAEALRPQAHVCIVLTDCETPWPDAQGRVPLIIAALVDHDSAALARIPAWAKVARIDNDA